MSTNYEQDLIVRELIEKSSPDSTNQFFIGYLHSRLNDETKEMHVPMTFAQSAPQDCLFLAGMIPDLMLSANVGKPFWVANTGGTYVVIGKLHNIVVSEE